MTTIGELDSKNTKAGEEPATPAEGKVTKGTAGVGKRQTFKYQGDGSEHQKPAFKHDLGTPFVVISAFAQAEGESVELENLSNYKLEGTDTVVRGEGTISKGTMITVVLSA